MKQFLPLIWTLCCVFSSFSQNQESFFKVYPSISEFNAAPSWAQTMYSQDPSIEDVNDLYDHYYSKNEFVKNIHTQNYKFWLKETKKYINENGKIRMPSEQELHDRMKISQSSTGAKMNSIWENIGPNTTYKNNGSLNLRPTQTNVTSIAVAPSNTDILYAGAATGGGVFKSVDHGMTWVLVTLDYPISDANDIKIHPVNPDIVYISNGSNIYKTTDGGLTWALNYVASGTVEQFYIHKTSPNIVFAATADGLLKTIDNGVNWNVIMNERCWDIEPHAIDPNTIYISIHNGPAARAEIYKTTDNGVNWTLKDNNWYLPTNIANASDIGCKIGVTPADPDRVYAGLIGNSKAGDNGWIGIYYSLDGADSWVNADGIDGGPYAAGNDLSTNWYVAGYSSGYHQGWYNFDLDVSHIDPDKLWVGTIWACESGNRGANIEYIRGTRNLEMHADIQDIDVVGNEIWYTSDGGINYSTDEMLTVEIRNTGISASTYWGFDQGWNEDVWTGGRYHNGDAVYHEDYGVGNTLFLGGAETATGYINPMDNLVAYFSDISDKNVKPNLNDVSTNRQNISKYPNEAYSILNSSEIVFHPNYANWLYLGKDNVFFHSIDGGVSFDTLYTFSATARVLEIEQSWKNPNVIYCLVRDNGAGKIYRSSNGGTTFNPMTTLPSNNISRLDLTIDPNDENNIWVSSHYGANGQKIYQSTSGGLVWINRSTASLDGHKIADVMYQAGTNDVVYLLTDLKVFTWSSALGDWVEYATGLPYNTRGLKFKPFYRDKKIRMSSDRGIWEADFAVESAPIAHPMTASSTVYCTRDTVQFEDHSFLNHTNSLWNWSFDPVPLFVDDVTKRNPRALFDAGTYDVILSITDQFGTTSIDTVSNMITVDNQCFADTIPGQALHCDSPNGHAIVPGLGVTQADSITFSAWIKPNGLQDSYAGIVFNDGVSAGLNFRANNELAYHWPGGSWWWSSGLFVDSNVWSHVALVAKPDGITLYLNGEPSTHTTTISPVDIEQIRLGSYKGWTSRNYRGRLDEVCIWEKALTKDEIRELRHLTRTGTTPFTDDLLAYYQFNHSGTEVLDRVNINHANLNGIGVKVLSTAPIGGGESHKVNIASAGPQTFGSTETEFAFGTLNPTGEVVVSRINYLPDSLPSTNSNTGNYWIVNNYGVDPIDPLMQMKLKSVNGYPYGLPDNSRLYARTENEDVNNWVELCGADNFNNSTYNYLVSCNVTQLGQFFIQSSTSDPIQSIYPYSYVDDELCSGDSIYLANAYQYNAGIYVDTVNFGVGIDSIQETNLTVLPLPQVSISSIEDLCVYDDPIQLNYGTPAGGTYTGTGVSGAIFDPSQAGEGTWTITYVFIDNNGCENSASSNVFVDGCLGIHTPTINGVYLYPNPTEDKVDIGVRMRVESLQIVDGFGRIVAVYENLQENEVITVDMASYAAGVYSVVAQSQDGASHVRLIKR